MPTWHYTKTLSSVLMKSPNPSNNFSRFSYIQGRQSILYFKWDLIHTKFSDIILWLSGTHLLIELGDFPNVQLKISLMKMCKQNSSIHYYKRNSFVLNNTWDSWVKPSQSNICGHRIQRLAPHLGEWQSIQVIWIVVRE